jgi:HAD superfamily hydrolase (TIGR01509 family)
MILKFSPLQALIFDVDGTLAETERDGHRVAFNQAFAEAGLDWHWSVELYTRLIDVAGGKERIIHYWQYYQPDFESSDSPDQFVAQLHRSKTDHYRQLLQEGNIPPRPGIQRLLQEARDAGLSLAIATTSALPNALALLETSIAPDSPTWFQVIAAGDMVAQKKPAPDVYHYVLNELGLSPQNCLVFEDSAQGLQSAQGAGLPVIITTHSCTQYQDFTGAALVLSDLGEPDRPYSLIQTTIPDPALTQTFHHSTHIDLPLLQKLLQTLSS